MRKLNWQIVDRYFAGEASAAERALVERWLARSPAFRMLVESLYRSGADSDAVRRASEEVRARLDRDIANATASGDRRLVPRRVVQVIRQRGVGILRAAAIVVLLLGGVIMVQQAVKVAGGRPTEIATARRSVTAPAGRRISVSLPDGSKAILSPGSRLSYAATFGADLRREVRLDGEAYFDVRHDKKRPFVVRAADLVAEDLGTQFIVRAYPEDRYGRIIVRQGLVGLAGAVIAPGELGRLSPGGAPVVESADTASWFAWTQGRLVFDGMSLRDALPKLNRWYDLKFRLATPDLGDRVIVATLPEHLDDDALTAIGLALKLDATRDGRVVTLRARS